MKDETARKERVNRLLALARAYRGWSVGELSAALGREPRRIDATNGNPRLDLLARLAEALDWQLGDVAASIWEAAPEGGGAEASRRGGIGFLELDRQAQEEHRRGDFRAMEETALAMRARARDGHERAAAANRLAGAHDGLGRYPLVLEAVREGLAESGVGPDLRLMLAVNLANASYTLWNIDESRSLAGALLLDLETGHAERDATASTRSESERPRLRRVAHAFSHAIRGHSERRLLARASSESEARSLAASSAQRLREAAARFTRLASDFADPQYQGLALVARGGLIEVRTALGELSPEEGVAEIVDGLEAAVDPGRAGSHHELEAWGWWSVFGANIALRAGDCSARGFSEEAARERALAICTNKAAEIADAVDSWPMRERAFSLEWCRRGLGAAGGDGPGFGLASWTLDLEDLRILVGTMARFPVFRRTGWQILEHANLALH